METANMAERGWMGDTSGGPWGPDDGPDEQCCETCGTELTWIECWQCFGHGDFDLYEEDPLLYAPGQTAACDECNGEGGWLGCEMQHSSASREQEQT
jgi:hypothetical protein